MNCIINNKIENLIILLTKFIFEIPTDQYIFNSLSFSYFIIT